MRIYKNSSLKLFAFAVFLLFGSANPALAEGEIEVTVLNYVKAKTSVHFDRILAKGDNFNRWHHNRYPIEIENKPQSSRRVNRDTLYSYAVVNISDGASLTIPESAGRYLSVQVINEDHFINHIYHDAGKYTLTQKEFDTPYVVLIARILADPGDEQDMQIAHAIQDNLKLKSNNDASYNHPKFDQASLKNVGDKLLGLAGGLPDANRCFGKKGQVDPVRHLLATAYGWGGLPESEAIYLNVQPDLAVGEYSLNVKDVPVDGFWSISVYNKDGFFEKNSQGIYSINNLSAKPDKDGSYTINFGGDSSLNNFLPITEGWNYVIRMYRPRQEVIDGSWRFPSID